MSMEDEAQFVNKTDSAKQQEEEEVPEPLPLKSYFASEYSYTIIQKKWVFFTLMAGVIYSYHLLWTIHGVDKYADNTRLLACSEQGQPQFFYTPGGGETSIQKAERQNMINEYNLDQGEKNSSVLDGAILLVTIYHMIEWIRWTFYLTMALVGVNLMKLYYVLSLNIIFGVIVLIVTLFTMMDEEATLCADTHQLERGRYLVNQWICAVLFLPFSFAHFLAFAVKGNNWCNEVYYAPEEEEDD